MKQTVLNAAFIFVAPNANPAIHRSVVETPAVRLTTVGVKDYKQAQKVARELVKQGVAAIELCGGFGIEGMAAVKKAVGDKAAVGAVRFDSHPGLGGKSGDCFFK